ncbi:HNH endonuclease [Acetobacter okinawensis]|uniref:HNH endonuclease n=1 Tax=Acetobacter okinawensis TaxID=1076594 RepID=UPI0034E20598
MRDYVLTRAVGTCETCRSPAPFLTGTGQPYLEAHHVHKLSDGGSDHPASVAALRPTCHRQAHFGADQAISNNELLERVRRFEKWMNVVNFWGRRNVHCRIASAPKQSPFRVSRSPKYNLPIRQICPKTGARLTPCDNFR